MPTDVQWDLLYVFLILIAGKSQNEGIDDAKSMSAQTIDFDMNYILYGAIHML